MVKVESVKVTDVLDFCHRLDLIPEGTDTLVLMTSSLYSAIEKTALGMDCSFTNPDGTSSHFVINSCVLYARYQLSMIRVALTGLTGWTALVAFNRKSFPAVSNGSIIVFDLA